MSSTANPESTSTSPEAQRIRDVFDLHELGVGLYRQRMRRDHPEAADSEIESLTRAWLLGPPRPDRLRTALGDRAW